MILFLDIDGTVCVTVSGNRWGHNPKDHKVMRTIPQAIDALPPNTTIIGVSNQGGVDYGYKSLEDCKTEQSYKLSLMPWMTAIFFCPDMDGKKCFKASHSDIIELSDSDLSGSFRKPDDGMLELGFRHYPTKARINAWMIGDRYEDRDCARNAKINFAWASEWRNGIVDILSGGSAILSDNDPIPF